MSEKFCVDSHLLEDCHVADDTFGDDLSLRFLRDAAGREFDFVVMRNGKPEFAVERKAGERSLSRNIEYFAQDTEWADSKARILPFVRLAQELKL